MSYNNLLFVILAIILIIVIYKLVPKNENFGALQSLYSNDGIQDAYLTIENDPVRFNDPYRYWRGLTWNLPTRNLHTITYYPFLYDHMLDRYSVDYPYWSL